MGNINHNVPLFIRCKLEVIPQEDNPFGRYELFNHPVNIVNVTTIEKIERQAIMHIIPGQEVTRFTQPEHRKTVIIKGLRFKMINLRDDSDKEIDWYYPYGLGIHRDSDYEAIISAFEFKY